VSRAWTTLDRVASAGGELELRRRGEREFLITVDGRVLMTSAAHRSESALAEWLCEGVTRTRPRVLIGGLGMGYTLRAALDALPRTAALRVAELEPAVVAWCRGPLAPLTGRAIEDPRVEVVVADVMVSVRAAARGALPRFDAIALDLFEGPRGTRGEDEHPIWGTAALSLACWALAPGGALGIWCEEAAPGLARRLARVGLRAELRRAGRGGRRHALYRAVPASSSRRERPNRQA
jgi:predicted membrane-bound spermidine synthase